MDINQLRYLVEVNKTKSLRRAANNLYISQPTLSKGIKDLEQEFNISILCRNNRGIYLTTEGNEFLEGAVYILNQVDNFKRRYSIPLDSDKFNLRISSDIIFNLSGVISEVFNSLDEKYINLTVKEAFKEEVIKEVAARYSDLGFLSISSIDEKVWRSLIEINNLEFYEIKKEKIFVYIGKNNYLYNKKEIYPQELKNQTRIHMVGKTNLSITYNISSDILELLREDRIISLNDKETIAKVLQLTDTYTFAASCKNNEYRENVRSIPLINKNNIYTSIGWIKRKDEKLTNEASVFLQEFLKNIE